MSESKKETAPASAVKQTPKFSIARLRRDCLKLFGVTVSTFDGAAYGLSGTYSVEEMRAVINTWKQKKLPMKEGK